MMSVGPELDRQGTCILVYNAFWPSIEADFVGCSARCRLLTDPSRLAEVDAVVFHIPTLEGPLDLPKPAGQLWVGWSLESEAYYPLQTDPAFIKQFDLMMTYRQDADIWSPYFGPYIVPDLMRPPRSKAEPAPAVYFASNWQERSGRNAYTRELMRYMRVDSYGACLRNRSLVRDVGFSTKLATIARYKFTLAFENSIATDYVTDKFFHPLMAGSVPVYLGAPNVEDFAPGEHCYIESRDFAGPKLLADYLVMLDRDPDAYAAYLRWKAQPLRPSFLAMLERTRDRPFCTLCRVVARARARRQVTSRWPRNE
jgi:hypothetical protein